MSTSHWTKHLILATTLALFACGSVAAEIINYAGMLRVDGAPLNGTTQLKFAIVNSQGAAVWSTNELALPVTNGSYTVRLGDPTSGMPPIAAGLVQPGSKLRVWLNDKSHIWQQLGDDVAIPGGAPVENNPAPVSITAPQADAILAELREIHTLLARQAAAPPPAPAASPQAPAPPQIVSIPIGDGPSLGKPDAPVILVEFTDFQCGFCKKFHDETFPTLKKNFVDSGKMRVLTRNLPLSFHAQAEPAARAALCANQQQKFWPMREELFKLSNTLSPVTIEGAAKDAGLEMNGFHACVERPETAAAVAADGKVAAAASISGTPTFVLGKLENGNITGVRLVGAQPEATFEAEINKALALTNPPVKTAQN